ncbi:hypothetical protein KKA39_02720 [Patescibacteria group bacterium]|nr:hypothetical protein [Patescibacteria group bacterium]MBU1728189.1 hypothetical protein [Patescibacteria group bacterium]
MKKISPFLVALLAIFLVQSCKTVSWTQLSKDMVKDYELVKDGKLEKLQYSNGENIIEINLVRVEKTDTINLGVLEDKKTSKSYTFRIPPKTPGKLISYSKSQLNVAFDGRDSVGLPFVMRNGVFVLKTDNDTTIIYRGEPYRIIEGSEAGLFINLRQLELLEKEKVVATGIIVEQ